MGTTSVVLVTFAEFERLPDPSGGVYELHHGEVVFMPPPKQGHKRIQFKLRYLLSVVVDQDMIVGEEIGFRCPREEDYRIVDVGVLSLRRWESAPADGYLTAAPDLVVEVLSPSNRAAELMDREQVCFENGCREFWVVDPVRRQVRVSTSDCRLATHKAGSSIPLWFGGTIAVDDIFA